MATFSIFGQLEAGNGVGWHTGRRIKERVLEHWLCLFVCTNLGYRMTFFSIAAGLMNEKRFNDF